MEGSEHGLVRKRNRMGQDQGEKLVPELRP